MAAARTFLVTGATGFVGSHLVPRLAELYGPEAVTALCYRAGRESERAALQRFKSLGVRLIEGDLLKSPPSTTPPPSGDIVYHLAGFAETETASGPFHVNSEGTTNLLRWLGADLNGKRVVYTGTLASVDRDAARGPITEDTPCTPKTAYGKTKLKGEQIVRTAARELGYDFTILRLCTIIGPGFRRGGMFGIFPRLLSKGAIATRLNWPGRASFLNVFDLVDILVKVAELEGTKNETYVVSNGEGPTFDEFLDQMAEVLGIRRRRVELPPWLWAATRSCAWRLAGSDLMPEAI
jgi:nucleoside-diphosphate-sugar epimerase